MVVVHTTYCTLHTAHSALHTAYCMLHGAYYALHTAHCTLHIVQCTLLTAHCSLHTLHCILHTAYCMAHRTLLSERERRLWGALDASWGGHRFGCSLCSVMTCHPAQYGHSKREQGGREGLQRSYMFYSTTWAELPSQPTGGSMSPSCDRCVALSATFS